ncbi:hypothetical protein QUA46_15070 [Microcoleus sp. MON2_D6]|uniref:hypothetical protein n=2 Tax=unclassified Microcoleus TaxID=2642155 RepID=UPI002FCF752A
MWEEKTTNQPKFQQTRYCRMSIVKKLPAVLMAAVGISFSFASTALAQKILLGEKTLGLQEDVDFKPQNRSNMTICFQTTDNLPGSLILIYMASSNSSDIKMERLKATPTEQCISRSVYIIPARVSNIGRDDIPGFSRSVRVRATQG